MHVRPSSAAQKGMRDAPMRAETAQAPEAITFERAYPGTISQPRQVRADLSGIARGFPAMDELLLLTSELAANAILHSRSGRPGGTFTVSRDALSQRLRMG